jgi:ABC-2 type transport system permease protein
VTHGVTARMRNERGYPMSAIAVPRAGTPALAPPGFAWRVFADEAGKGLRLMWRHRAITITALMSEGIMFLAIQFFIGGGHLLVPVLALTLPGLFAVAVAYTASIQGAGGIAEEVNGGTLEQAHLSPARPSVLVAGRLAALAVEGLIPAAVLTLAFGLGYGPHWVIRPGALVPLALTILDALGYALLMTALVLRVASIGAGVHVFNMAIMFFGGMLIPITLFPHGVEIFARFLPTALGVEVLNTTLSGRGLGTAWSNGTLPWLLVHVVVLGGLAWATYLYTVRRARREGGLSPR